MLLMTGESLYADIMERALYNGAVSGISLQGDRFFYENRLASRGGVERWVWHRCPCCPANIASDLYCRLLIRRIANQNNSQGRQAGGAAMPGLRRAAFLQSTLKPENRNRGAAFTTDTGVKRIRAAP